MNDAARAEFLSLVLSTFVIRRPEGLSAFQSAVVYSVVAVVGGTASVANAWLHGGQLVLRSEMALDAFLCFVMIGSLGLSGFALGLAGIHRGLLISRLLGTIGACFLLAVVASFRTSAHIHHPAEWQTAFIVAIVLSLGLPAAFVAWKVGRVGREWLSDAPWIWWSVKRLGPPLGFAAIGYLLLAALFGTFHAAIWQASHAAYEPDKMQGSLGEFMYFSFVTLTTVGYGDIHPQSGPARFCAVAEMLCGVVWTVLRIGVVLSRLSSTPEAPTPTSPASK